MAEEEKPQTSSSSKDDNKQSDGASSGTSKRDFEAFLEMFARKLGFGKTEETPPDKVLEKPTFDELVKYMKSGKCKNVIVLSGAGISTSAGIPDFRSPGSGLYDNLQKYNLPYPQAIFEISFFLECPQPFFTLAKELYPGCFKPTIGHYFIRLLHEKGLLLRTYTQNIDTLERIAGIPEEKIVEAHGTFFTSHCLNDSCRKEYSLDWMKEKIFADIVPYCTECSTVVKPDIVFFGETLPDKFYDLLPVDFPKCDLLIVMGTSLVVQPFASLVDRVPTTTPRLLINKEKAGENDYMSSLLGFDGGMKFDSEDNYRDVAWIGSCDDGCAALAKALGWEKELNELVSKEHSRIDKETEAEKTKK